MSLGAEESFTDSEHAIFVEMPAYIAGTMGNLLLQRADKLLTHVMHGWRRVVVESRSYTPAQRNLMDLQDVLSIPPEARTTEDAASAYEAFLSLHNQFVAGLPPEVALELCKSLNLLELYKDNKVHHPCADAPAAPFLSEQPTGTALVPCSGVLQGRAVGGILHRSLGRCERLLRARRGDRKTG